MLFVVMEKGARDLAAFLKDRARRRDLRIGTVEAFWQDMVEAVAAIHESGRYQVCYKEIQTSFCEKRGTICYKSN